MPNAIDVATPFNAAGWISIEGVLSPLECAAIADSITPSAAPSGGTRALLAQPWCQQLAARIRLESPLAALIPPEFVAVQCTYFEKSAAKNWLVPWHQDLSIPVAERVEHSALSGWSEKEGGLFVHAPPGVLEQLIAVRLHLDVCSATDGPLKVLPGTHLLGRLSPAAVESLRCERAEVACLANMGGAIVLRPLLVHASSKANGASRRRVLHFVFGPAALPCGLRWREMMRS